jgi:hypothetical protein
MNERGLLSVVVVSLVLWAAILFTLLQMWELLGP